MNLTNKTIIVTGSGRGIGKHIAKRLAAISITGDLRQEAVAYLRSRPDFPYPGSANHPMGS